jgi:iron complex transport system substrate-binding protein
MSKSAEYLGRNGSIAKFFQRCKRRYGFRRSLSRAGSWVSIALCTALLVSACGERMLEGDRSLSSHRTPATQTRVIHHALGNTTVPINPQRIVTLDGSGLENVLALGLKPVGTVLNGEKDQQPPHLDGKLSGIERVGTIPQPSLEKILSLKPDLMLSIIEVSSNLYPKLTQIAPTVLAPFEGGDSWKESLNIHADALGKSELAQQWMQRYQERLATFQQQMGKRLENLEVSVVRIYPEGPSLYLPDSFSGEILQEAGLSRPPSQRGTGGQRRISQELLSQADGDVLFLWTSDDDIADRDTALERLKSDPLWSQLKAVQQNKVYEVPGYWIGFGPLAANAVVDDLFKYLLPTEREDVS